MELRVLGPLEVLEGGALVDVGGPRPRALLARLVVDAGQVVPADRLAEDLWPDDAPDRSLAALRTLVARTRRALRGGPRAEDDADEGPLRTRSPGYVLVVGRGDVDATRFEDGVRAARAAQREGDAARALEQLDAALGLWRGDAYVECADLAFVRGEAARLDELRRGALEDRVEVRLALGDHLAAIPEIESLVAAHPLRERLWGQLMVALYRAGRQADALRAFQDLRRALGDELGIEPGPDLVRLEAAVLQQSPELDWRAAAAVVTVPPAPSPPASPAPAGRDTPGVLELLAVAGTAAELPVVAAAGELDESALLGALESAIATGAVEEVDGPALRYRFVDEHAREAVYDSLSATRRALLHRRVAEAIEAVHGDRLDGHVAALALHYARSGGAGAARALEHVRRLGAAGVVGWAGDVAQLYRDAAALAADLAPEDLATRVDLLLGLAGALPDRPADRRRALVDAVQLAAAAGDAPRLARAGAELGHGVLGPDGPDPDEASDVVAALDVVVAATAATDDPAPAQLLADLALALAVAGDHGRATATSDEAVAVARRLDDDGLLAAVLERRLGTTARTGDDAEHDAVADEVALLRGRAPRTSSTRS